MINYMDKPEALALIRKDRMVAHASNPLHAFGLVTTDGREFFSGIGLYKGSVDSHDENKMAYLAGVPFVEGGGEYAGEDLWCKQSMEVFLALPNDGFYEINAKGDPLLADDGLTYLIQSGPTYLFKIGFSSSPRARIAQLQTGNPFRLSLRASIRGNHERALHKQFSKYREDGEWFSFQGAAVDEHGEIESPRDEDDLTALLDRFDVSLACRDAIDAQKERYHQHLMKGTVDNQYWYETDTDKYDATYDKTRQPLLWPVRHRVRRPKTAKESAQR